MPNQNAFFPGFIKKLCLFVCFFLSFLAWPFLPSHSSCRALSLHLIALNSTHMTLVKTPLDEWSAGTQRPLSYNTQHFQTQRPVSYNTQHSQQTNIHASGGIRTRNPSKWADPDLRLRTRGCWVRPGNTYLYLWEHQDRYIFWANMYVCISLIASNTAWLLNFDVENRIKML